MIAPGAPCSSPCRQLRRRTGNDRHAVLMVGPPDCGGIADVLDRSLLVAQKFEVAPRRVAQAFRSLGGKQQDAGLRGLIRCLRRGKRIRRRGFQQHVGIGAADPKGIHRGHGPSAGRRPGLQTGGHTEPQPLKRDRGIGRLKMQAGRDRSILQRKRRLDQAGQTRRRFQMSDVGLDRTEDTRAAGIPLAEHLADRGGLHRDLRWVCRCRAPRHIGPRKATRRPRAAPRGSSTPARPRSARSCRRCVHPD